MQFSNYHTHTDFSDGREAPLKYVEAAVNKGLKALAFSDHSPLPFDNTFALTPERLPEYARAVRGLREQFAGVIDLWLSMEFDYIPGMTADFQEIKKNIGLDFTIGSVHLVRNFEKEGLWFIDGVPDILYHEGLKLVFDLDIRRAVEAYYHQVVSMVRTQQPDIIGHFDKIKMHNKGKYFSEEDPWYRDLVLATLEEIAAAGSILEVNTRGVYRNTSGSLFPSEWILEQCLRLNIPVLPSSDAHKPHEVIEYFPETVEILKRIGFRHISVFENGTFVPVTIP